MTDSEKLNRLLEESPNGVILAKEVSSLGIHRELLRSFCNQSKLIRAGRGVYLRPDAWEDELFLLQNKYPKAVFSHNTALWLLGYSDRTPLAYDLTLPQGYHASSLARQNVRVRHILPKNHVLGIAETKTPYGNLVRIYDLERTLCDIVRGKGVDVQIVVSAMQKYAQSVKKDINRLICYANQLHVAAKIRSYMQALL